MRHATTKEGTPTRVFLPKNTGTQSIFVVGEAHSVFPGMPEHVTLFKRGEKVDPGANDVVIETGPTLKPADPMPYWSGRWDWLRRFARLGSGQNN